MDLFRPVWPDCIGIPLLSYFVNWVPYFNHVLTFVVTQDSLVDERFQPLPAPSLSSFKRAQQQPAVPAMGGRAVVEQRRQEDNRRSRSKGAAAASSSSPGNEKSSRGSSSSKADRRVGQLDERNLKRAAHRYGTLPKGARIGAYLESLRASGLTPEPVLSSDGGGESGHDTLDSQRSGHTDPGPGGGGRVVEPPQPLHLMSSLMMARSNSSHGGFPGVAASSPSGGGPSSQAGGHASRPAGPRSGQLPRRLPTYTQGSAPLRGASSSGGKTSALLELDFPPPPPTDHHPEESGGGPFTTFQPAAAGHSQQLPLPSSPSLQQRIMRGAGAGREPSPDSCSSLRSYSEQQQPQRTSPLPPQEGGHQTPTFTTFTSQQHQLVTEMMLVGGGGGATPPRPPSSPLPPSVDQVIIIIIKKFMVK
jgi:hypothetical protein